MRDAVFKGVELGTPTTLEAVNPLQRDQRLVDANNAEARIALAEKEAASIAQVARDMIAKARERAEEIIAEAQEQADTVTAEATDKGFQEGHEAGLQQGYEAAALETMELLQAATIVMEGVKVAERISLTTCEPQAIALMEGILKEVSAHVWEHMPVDILKESWSRAVRVHGIKKESTLLLHPAHLQMIEALGDEAQALLSALPNTQFKTDHNIPMDAVYVLNDEKNLELTLASTIRELCKELST